MIQYKDIAKQKSEPKSNVMWRHDGASTLWILYAVLYLRYCGYLLIYNKSK